MGLLLGLESQGVSSCIINWPDMPDKEAAMRKLLGLEAHERVIMLIAYGYPDPESLVPFSAKRAISDARQYRTLPSTSPVK
jgi:nitroreductase